jgi:predicted acetyltransferase
VNVEYRTPSAEEFADVLRATYTAFGEAAKDDDLERDRLLLPADRILAAWDNGRPVGVTASYEFEQTVPGGVATAAGVTAVGVLPSHRRRGILRELMVRQLEDVRSRGEPLAILWASESLIYGRFGYGIAIPQMSIDAERSAFALRDDPGTRGSVRLVTADEAAELFPPVYDSHRRQRPGLISRSEVRWKQALLADPEHWRDGAGPRCYALLELDGEASGFAVYRVAQKWEGGNPRGELRVNEAFAVSPEATAELWRFLFGVDLVTRVKFSRADPALFLMTTDPRRLHISMSEGLWLRLVDVDAALRARGFEGQHEVVLEVADDVLAVNAGRYAVGPSPGRTDAEPDVALHVADLASAYLGGFTFERLAAAGRARELRPGGLARATSLFSTPMPPFCPEGF